MSQQPDNSRGKEPRRLLLERRMVVRFPAQLEAVVHTGGGKTAVEWPARVRDLSVRGIGLILPRGFAPGTLVTIKLIRDKDMPSITISAEVLHVLSESCGYVHGCQFTQALSNDELSLLLQ